MRRIPASLLLALAGLACLFARDCLMLRARAQPALERAGDPTEHVAPQTRLGQVAGSLESALLIRLRLPSGRDMRHCRMRGCDAYAHRLALTIRDAAAQWEVDPFLLAAIAVRESSLVETARGAAGEHGVMQLHPRSPAGLQAARECRIAPSDCTAIEVGLAAELVARSLQLCGSEAAALGRYHRGRCGADDYARSILRIRDELRGGG